MEKLFVVVQEPKRDARHALVSIVWFTKAKTKTGAIRRFIDECPGASTNDPYYKMPRAQELVVGGHGIRV